jgi:hypothetical protein
VRLLKFGSAMRLPSRRNLAIGGIVIAAAAGGGGAYAASQGSGTGRQAFLDDAAHRLNVSPAQLESALRGAYSDRLDAAVAAGKLTQAQADAIKRHGLPFAGRRERFGRGILRSGLAAAESYLHLSGPQIRSELASGKSLAQVATEHGKTASGLSQAIETGVRNRLDAAVRAHGLTSAQEERILARLSARIDALVNRGGGVHRLGGFHRHHPF